MNQRSAANAELDVFLNGTLSPVRLVESEDDASEIASNPNIMSEDTMRKLFAARAGFKAKLGGASQVVTLRRMLEVANEVDATVGQVNAIKARIDELTPSVSESETAVERRGLENRRAGITPL